MPIGRQVARMLEKHAKEFQVSTRSPLGRGCERGGKKLGEEVGIAWHNKVKYYLQYMWEPC